jgi:hypothetical protein
MSKLQTYLRFNGDIDGWARVSKKSETDITDNEWTLLDQLIQKLTICKRGLGSEEFCRQANDELHQLAPQQDVSNAILKLVTK